MRTQTRITILKDTYASLEKWLAFHPNANSEIYLACLHLSVKSRKYRTATKYHIYWIV